VRKKRYERIYIYIYIFSAVDGTKAVYTFNDRLSILYGIKQFRSIKPSIITVIGVVP